MLTVSIVTYRTCIAELENCLRALNVDIVDHVYVVDNSSQDDIAAVCRKWDVEYIANRNAGYGAAHNIAIKKSLAIDADYHLVLNSDILFNSDILKSIVDYMDNNPEIGQLQPKITYPDGALQYTCRLLPTPLDLFIRRFAPKAFFKKRKARYLLTGADWDKPFDVAYQQGSFLFFRTKALKDIGLFDERFFMYPEDIDISRRMARSWKVRYWPGGTIVHHHRSASYHSAHMLWIHLKNMARYFNKWGWFCDKDRRSMNLNTISQFENLKVREQAR